MLLGEPLVHLYCCVDVGRDQAGALSPTLLSNVHFSVFGLGNRQYEHYNAMGRLVNRRLTELGAITAYKYGEGDDDGTLAEDFDAWKEDLWMGLKEHMGLNGGASGAGAAAGKPVVARSRPSHRRTSHSRPARRGRAFMHICVACHDRSRGRERGRGGRGTRRVATARVTCDVANGPSVPPGRSRALTQWPSGIVKCNDVAFIVGVL